MISIHFLVKFSQKKRLCFYLQFPFVEEILPFLSKISLTLHIYLAGARKSSLAYDLASLTSRSGKILISNFRRNEPAVHAEFEDAERVDFSLAELAFCLSFPSSI